MARSARRRQRDTLLGERLRRRRRTLGLTAKRLARAACVSPSYISQIERGKQTGPSLEVLGARAAALEVPLATLLGMPAEERPAAVPPALTALSVELGLSAQTAAMLSTLHHGPHQPATREGWLLIWLAIQAACTQGQEPLAP
jgi:transcriptional regulator with XRE-family HTH domain